MDKKSLLVVIIVIILVIIAIALLIGYVLSGGSLETKDIIGNTKELEKPIIELYLNSTEYTSKSVIINIETYMNDGTDIESIILPNNQEVISNITQYEVESNGDYEFIVKAENGEISKKVITVNNIINSSPDMPYIPDGFTHVENTDVRNGYTIIDDYGNEFVWVPVATGKLVRRTEDNKQYIENISEIEDFKDSVLKYFGFYIAKYEASNLTINGKETISSKKDVIPISNINYNSAYKKSQEMCEIYKYKDLKTTLMNSYAWDTTLNWIDSRITNYSSNISYGNYSGIISTTGSTESDVINNICDLAGNLREWTTETYYTELDGMNNDNIYRVIRGGSANIEKVAKSHIVYPETMSDTYWGFRIILYKK